MDTPKTPETPPIAVPAPPSAHGCMSAPRTVRALIRCDGTIELTPLVEGAASVNVPRLSDLRAAMTRVRNVVLRPYLRPFVTALADALAATLKGGK